MDYDYIRLLMLYSDVKYPFEKAKADPGLAEGLRSVRQYLHNNGNTRRESSSDLQRALLLERQMKNRMQRDEMMKRMEEQLRQQLKDKTPNIPPASERDKE